MIFQGILMTLTPRGEQEYPEAAPEARFLWNQKSARRRSEDRSIRNLFFLVRTGLKGIPAHRAERESILFRLAQRPCYFAIREAYNFSYWSSMRSKEKFSRTLRQAASPNSRPLAGFSRSVKMASASCREFRASTSKPSLPFSANSGIPPASHAITGLAIAMASKSAFGHPSRKEARTKISKEERIRAASSRIPEKIIRRPPSRARALAFMASKSGPPPAKRNQVSRRPFNTNSAASSKIS